MLLTEYLDMKNTRTASEPSAQLRLCQHWTRVCSLFCQEETSKAKKFSVQKAGFRVFRDHALNHHSDFQPQSDHIHISNF
ncbi:hypothetical protein H8959_008602 [Pygathrix nigripes]